MTFVPAGDGVGGWRPTFHNLTDHLAQCFIADSLFVLITAEGFPVMIPEQHHICAEGFQVLVREAFGQRVKHIQIRGAFVVLTVKQLHGSTFRLVGPGWQGGRFVGPPGRRSQ